MRIFNKCYLFPLMLVFSCDSSENDEVSCPAVIPPALVISIIDKETSESISCGVSILIEDGSYSEELSNPNTATCDNNLSLSGGLDREGVYNVYVYKEGYVDWSGYDIEVIAGECGVNTVAVEALLGR